MRKQKEEYDWLEDPFDEKKQAQDQEMMRTSSGAKAAVGCLAVIVVILVIVFAVGMSFIS